MRPILEKGRIFVLEPHFAEPQQQSCFLGVKTKYHKGMGSHCPRFSILVPAFNGMPFLRHTVETALAAGSDSFELVVSDDHSKDGGLEFLAGLRDPRLRVLQTPESSSFSMVEHWEWLLGHARGDWIMFLGQDDGLQSHFFELATRLADHAEELGLRTIAAQRAEFVWPIEAEGSLSVSLRDPSRASISRRSYSRHALLALFSLHSYHFLPQMYTNSLWQKSLIDDVRRLQGGVVFTCHPQDANIAALGARLEKEYLYSELSLGWVGTSKKSAGLAIAQFSAPASRETESLATEYAASVRSSPIRYPKWAGDFEMGENGIYFWQALRKTHFLGRTPLDRVLGSSSFITALLTFSLARHRVASWSPQKRKQYWVVAKRNKVSYELVVFLALIVRATFVLVLNARGALRLLRGVLRGAGKPKHWTSLEVSDFSEVLPSVRKFGAAGVDEIAFMFAK